MTCLRLERAMNGLLRSAVLAGLLGTALGAVAGDIPRNFCKGKALGNHPHPRDCTHYVACTASGIPQEQVCEPCLDPSRCPEGGTLKWDRGRQQCTWPSDAQCGATAAK
jgi:hypothetical protein